MTTEKNTFLKTAEKANTFRYMVTQFNKDGWAEAKSASPIPFDLVTVEVATGQKVAAWWNKFNWEGLRLKNEDIVVRWKRRMYDHIA